MTATDARTAIPGYIAGTWTIDPVHSEVGFTATAEINRSDFGITYNAAIEGGGVVVSDKVTIQLEIEAVLKA